MYILPLTEYDKKTILPILSWILIVKELETGLFYFPGYFYNPVDIRIVKSNVASVGPSSERRVLFLSDEGPTLSVSAVH